jgi:hypothetical protein
MKGSNLDKLYAEIINQTLLKYCSEMGFDYEDYEFLVFYGTGKDETRAVGAISGNLDQDFVNGINTVMEQIRNGMNEDDQNPPQGLVDT